MQRVNEVSFPGLGIKPFEVNSVAFSVGNLSVAWYSLIITTGILLAILYVWFRFKEAGLTIDDLLDFSIAVVPCGIIGARLYYVIFEFDNFYYEGDFVSTLVDILQIWNGGLAIYGGIIAGGLAAICVAHFKKINLLKILDILAPAVMMAQAIGRWGNFMNVEAFGGPTTLPWRMCSPRIAKNLYYNDLITSEEYYDAILGKIGAHPTFLYESLWNITGFIILYFVFVRTKKYHKVNGQLFYSYLLWYGLGRLWIEGLRTDSLYLGPIRVSQLVALLSMLSGIGLLIFGFVRLNKYGKGKMVVVIPRDKEGKIITQKEADKLEKEEKQKAEAKKANGTNNQRKRSSSKSKRKH